MDNFNLTEGQTDLLFTMLCAEAFGINPFEMEEILVDKGIINQPSTL